MIQDKKALQLIVDSIDEIRKDLKEVKEKVTLNHDDTLKLEGKFRETLSQCNIISSERINTIEKQLLIAIHKTEKELSEKLGLVRDEIFTDISAQEKQCTENFNTNKQNIGLLTLRVSLYAGGVSLVISLAFLVIKLFV